MSQPVDKVIIGDRDWRYPEATEYFRPGILMPPVIHTFVFDERGLKPVGTCVRQGWVTIEEKERRAAKAEKRQALAGKVEEVKKKGKPAAGPVARSKPIRVARTPAEIVPDSDTTDSDGPDSPGKPVLGKRKEQEKTVAKVASDTMAQAARSDRLMHFFDGMSGEPRHYVKSLGDLQKF